jgi:hypothetical protein
MLSATRKLAMPHRSIFSLHLPGNFAYSTRLPTGLIILSSDKAFPQLFVDLIRITLEVSNEPELYFPALCERSSKPPTSHWRLSHRRNLSGFACAGFPRTSHCDGSHKKVADEEDGKTYEYDSEGHRREVTT